MGLAEVSAVLWRERELLEMLLFKLEEEQLLLAAGGSRWLARASREVEVVLTEIRRTEVRRAMEVEVVATALGLPPTPTLAELTRAVDEPWRTVFRGHRHALLAATAEVSARAEANRGLLAEGYRAVCEALRSRAGDVVTSTPTGSGTRGGRGGRRRGPA